MTERVDAVVVGAGPAGTAAAITLRRASLRVTVVDRARFPRDKCCGDGLTAAALRRLEELGLDPEGVASWTGIDRIRLRGPTGRVVQLSLPADGLHAAVARRSDLDAALVDLARRAGADVREGTAPERLEVTDGGAVVTTPAATLATPYVVAADGAWSPTRKLVGGPGAPYLGDWHAMRQYVTGVDDDACRHLWVWFEPDLLPGYAWSFPMAGGAVNFGYGIPRRSGERSGPMGHLWAALWERPHIRAVLGRSARPEGPVRAWPIPATVDPDLVAGAGGRVLYVGDAARLADPMTGEGIGQALESGVAAAAAILTAGRDRPELAAAHYREEMRAGVLSDNRLAALLSRLLGRAAGARGALALVGSSAWTRGNFARWMFEDYPRAVLATPGRWRRNMLTPAGAYGAVDILPRP
ncbi:MAG TPA: geranylgeranyl reductase family protein [Acidimicrobiales bacterium]|nr:geranylgeranyl reductase family protein [Acidimicrobiales bacterium]